MRWALLPGVALTLSLAVAAAAQTVPPPVGSNAQAPPQSVTLGPPMTLAQLEAMALENNPTLRQAQAEIDAARGRARQAGTFPNPLVGYTAEEVSGGPIIRGGEHGVFIEQTIPLGGKLGLSRSVFQREATQAEALAESQRQRVLNSVRVGYHEAVLAARRVDVDERLAQLTREAVGVTRQLFNVGAADKPDFLQSEIEERRAQIELTQARNMQFRVWRRLGALVGEPSLSPRPLDGALDALPELERTRLLEVILRDSPDLKAARFAAERGELALRRARKEVVPDMVVRGGPRYNRELLESSPTGPRAVGWEATIDVGFTLPIFNRNQGNIEAARAELSRSQSEIRRAELTLASRFADVFDEYLTSLRSAEMYRTDIVPRAEEAYQLYLSRFREMAAAYPQVLVAQRTLVQMNQQYLEALDTAWRASIQLQGFLLTEGLQAAPRPGETEPGMPGRAVVER